jgi:hypothetical protein
MKLFNRIMAVCILTTGSFSMSNALAIPTLSFNNSNADIAQTYNTGDIFSLDLWLSGLESEDLGGFDLNIEFDGGVTDYLSGSFISNLTDLLALPITDNANSIEMAGVFLSFDLSGQADAFQLATLNFSAISAGTSLVEMTNILLSDAFAGELFNESYTATITVESDDPPASVSEPTSIAMLLTGLLVLTRVRKRS